MSRLCYIFGASPEYSDNIDIIEKDSLIVAADGGFEKLKRLGITPDVVIGDFDSLGYIPNEIEIISYDKEKDDTDTMLAIKYGIEKGCAKFLIYGGLGGRLDHTIANIQSLKYLSDRNLEGWLIDGNTKVTVISSGSIEFNDTRKGTISVFALGETVNGVTIEGLQYKAENISLTNSFPLGVSNSFIGEKSRIAVEEGALLIVLIEE